MPKTRDVVIALATFAGVAIALWWGWYQYVAAKYPDTATLTDAQLKVLAARGQFGDLFGGVNALFTSLLLAGALYTVLLQQRQLAALQAQQASQERESKEIARLQAMTALVAARSTLVQTRYEMMRDMSAALSSNTVASQFVPLWQVMAFQNAEAAGNEFKSLGDLADKLDTLVNVKEDAANGAA